MSNIKELAHYLTELYRGVKITEKHVAQIDELEYNVGDQCYRIISDIDAILKTVPSDASLVVQEVEVVSTGYFQFSIHFFTDADVKLPDEAAPSSEKSKKLQNLFKMLGASGAAIGGGIAVPGGTAFPLKFKSVSQDHGDLHAALDELEVIGTAIDLIARIEKHNHTITEPGNAVIQKPAKESVLLKYIEKIEKLYLSDLL